MVNGEFITVHSGFGVVHTILKKPDLLGALTKYRLFMLSHRLVD